MSIGENIKKWRELRNLKQAELAELIGVSDKTISSWEINRTEPKMGMVEKICTALNCKKTDIIGENNINYTVDMAYYLDDETRIIVEQIHRNPDMRGLFDIARNTSPERLKVYYNFLKQLHDQDQHND